MKQTIDKHQFRRAFQDMGRNEQFSYDGLDALFGHLEDMEEQSDEPIELDVIGLCCEFAEVDEQEARDMYDIPPGDDWIDWLQQQTNVIPVSDDRFIILQFND